MDFLNGRIKPMYFSYLASAFGSAMITSIYSIVDMAMVGWYQGPEGTAALAVVAPLWNIIYSLGLLMGIGGSVIFSTKRGVQGGKEEDENQYFTASVIGSLFLAILAWLMVILFDEQILTFFGADKTLLPLAKEYMRPIIIVFPLFLCGQMLAAFLRNDKDPRLATLAVLSGGIFNIFGDYFFVFACDMGLHGAGLATALGAVISTCVMLLHFASRENTLKLTRTARLATKLKEIFITGFSTFFIDVAMGILTVMFNRQIMRYLDSSALAIYGPVIQVSTFVQCCAYAVGQAAQPIISVNHGAQRGERIQQALFLSLCTTAFLGIFWTLLSLAVPNLYIRIFMTPSEKILAMAPRIIRMYALSFLFLPTNIFSTYYFQAITKPRVAFVISVARGLVVSGVLILTLPLIAGPETIWLAMPLTELGVVIYALNSMQRCTKALSTGGTR